MNEAFRNCCVRLEFNEGVCLRAAQLLHNPQQFKRKTGWMVGNLSEILAGRMKSNCLVSPKFRAQGIIQKPKIMVRYPQG